MDEEIAQKLRRSGKPIVVVMNKLDNSKQEDMMIPDAYALGFDEVVGSSAEHNTGFGEMMDYVAAKLVTDEFDDKDDEIRVALVGRPNVGKSTLLNNILNKNSNCFFMIYSGFILL